MSRRKCGRRGLGLASAAWRGCVSSLQEGVGIGLERLGSSSNGRG